MDSEARIEAEVPASPSAWTLLRVWCTLGVQSFGGGVATLALMRRAVVEQYRWVSEADFLRDWALVNLAPGINLLALAILLGRRIAGIPGIFICMFGLLLPSAGVTILLTAFYARVQNLDMVQATVRGMLPAVLGIGLLTSCQMARPLLVTARTEGRASLVLTLLLITASAVAAMKTSWPVLLILFASGGVAACFYGRSTKRVSGVGCWVSERTNDERPTTNEEGESNLTLNTENQKPKTRNQNPTPDTRRSSDEDGG